MRVNCEKMILGKKKPLCFGIEGRAVFKIGGLEKPPVLYILFSMVIHGPDDKMLSLHIYMTILND